MTIEGCAVGMWLDGARRRLTAIAEEHYARIAAEDGAECQSSGGRGINSFLALSRERAMAQAERIDAHGEAKGEELPVLAGVPVGVQGCADDGGNAGDGGVADSSRDICRLMMQLR